MVSPDTVLVVTTILTFVNAMLFACIVWVYFNAINAQTMIATMTANTLDTQRRFFNDLADRELRNDDTKAEAHKPRGPQQGN